MEESAKVYEGFITRESMPLAFAAAEEISGANQRISALPDEQRTDEVVVNQLQENTKVLLSALARLELAVNMNAGDAFTGRPPMGSMTFGE